MIEQSLRITEIFFSLQGEARTMGLPTVFIRLTGCPLRCRYCDSEYAFFGGQRMLFTDILENVAQFNTRYVCVTGGEPLAQPACRELLTLLCERGFSVSLETSGALDIAGIDQRVSVVMDLKTPASGEVEKNRYQNIEHLQTKDQIKFVICSREDFEWAKFKVDEYQLTQRVDEVLFSPSFGEISAQLLAEWILRDKLQVRFQLQLHKQLWGDKPGV